MNIFPTFFKQPRLRGLLLIIAGFIAAWPAASSAETLIETSLYGAASQYGPSPDSVFINSQTGYVFFVDAAGTVAWRKTVDSGTTWGATNLLGDGNDQDAGNVGIWYDRWTSDSTGTLVHVVHIGSKAAGGNQVCYNAFDTQTETPGSWRLVQTGLSYSATAGASPVVTRTASGNLYVYSSITNRISPPIYSSSFAAQSGDNGNTWVMINPSDCASNQFYGLLLPVASNQVMLIQHQTASNVLRQAVWDENTSSWSGWSTMATGIYYVAGYNPPFAAVRSPATSNIYLTVHSRVYNAAGDVWFLKYDAATAKWSAPALFFDDASQQFTSIGLTLDSRNEHLYAVYTKDIVGYYLSTYYRVSTDGGTHWSAESPPLNSTALNNFRFVRGNFASPDCVFTTWNHATLYDLYGAALILPTAQAPTAPTGIVDAAASKIGAADAKISARITGAYPSADAMLRWGTWDGTTSTWQNIWGPMPMLPSGDVAFTLTNLAAATTYYAEFTASNAQGAVTSQTVLTFTTLPTATLLDSTIQNATVQGAPSPSTVFVNSNTGYVFYVDQGGTSRYCRTSNGGTSWSTPTMLGSGDAQSDGTLAVWYDPWTPSNTGTRIHIAHIGKTLGNLNYTYLDTTDDSVSAWRSALTSITPVWVAGTHGPPSIIRTTDGRLAVCAPTRYYTAPNLDAAIAISADNGTTWLTNDCPDGTNFTDFAQLMPLAGGDILYIQQRTAGNFRSCVQRKLTGQWSPWSTNDLWTSNNRYMTPWAAVLDPLTFDVYLAASTPPVDLGKILIYRFSNQRRSWETMGQLVKDNYAKYGPVTLAIDPDRGDLYASYLKGRLHPTGWTTPVPQVNIYYRRSTDHGRTWDAAETRISAITNDYRVLRGGMMSRDRIYLTAHTSANGLYGMTVRALESAGGHRPLPGPPAASVTDESHATVSTVLDDGGLATDVTVYYGTSDAGTTGTWDHAASAGTCPAGPVNIPLSGLTEGTPFYYRIYAQNSSGASWSENAGRFTTALNPSAYARKMKITLTGYTNTVPLTNFPVLVVLNETPRGFKYAEFASPTGDDLRFTADDGNRTLNREIEAWNTSGNSYVWVNLPVLTNGATLWAHWGNPGATAINGAAVWTTDYIGVWHLAENSIDETSATVHRDSTVYAHHGSQTNNGPAAGIIAGAQNFDGTADFISVPPSPTLTITGPRTISAWIRPNALGAGNRVVIGKSSWVGCTNLALKASPGGESGPLLTTSSWQHVAYVQTETNVTFYYNGALVYATNAVISDSLTERLDIGAFNGTLCFNGRIDEARLEAGIRTPEWLLTCYQNQSAPLAFAAPSTVYEYPDLGEPTGATNVSADSADLQGNVISTGTTATTVWFYYGQTDGGKDTNAWDHALSIGPQPVGACTGTVSNLKPAVRYFYRVRVVNDAGDMWTDTAATFITPMDGLQFNRKMKITLAGPSSTALTDFPALIEFNEALRGFKYGEFGSSTGMDLRFTADDGTTLLPYEIEKWNTGGNSFTWVRIPALTNNTVIWAFWGFPQIHTPCPVNPADTWNTNFAAVWHLSENSTDEKTNMVFDATANTNHCQQFNTAGGTGIIAGAQVFDGNTDYIQSGTNASLTLPGARTISAWINPAVFKVPGTLIGKVKARAATPVYGGYGIVQSNQFAGIRSETQTAQYIINPPAPSNVWTHIAWTIPNDGNAYLYMNGELAGSCVFTNSDPAGYPVFLGGWISSTYDFNGRMDEVRIESGARSAEWLRACYHNQSTPLTYAAASTVVQYPDVAEPSGATNISASSADLQVSVLSTGTTATTVWFYYGQTDGGKDTNAWDHALSIGPQPAGACSGTANGLQPSVRYFYRARVVNDAGEIWTDTAAAFVTLMDGLQFNRKMKITLTGYTNNAPLANFPALIVLNETPRGFKYADFTSPSGNDLRFTTEDGIHTLYHEIEYWHTNGNSYVWVNIPVLTNGTTLWAYWSNPSTPALSGTSVWSTNYIGVWHLAESSTDETNTTVHRDSTAYAHHGSQNNNGPTTGIIAGAQNFDGTADFISVPASSSLTVAGPRTISAWIRPNTLGAGDRVVAGKSSWVGCTNLALKASPGGESGPLLTTSSWQHVAYVQTETNVTFYYNGALVCATNAATSDSPTNRLDIGAFNGTLCFNGRIDEARLEAGARTPEWLQACYQNQSAPLAYAAASTVVQYPDVAEPSGATNISASSADLQVSVLSTGTTATTVWFYYGQADGGKDTNAWDHALSIGPQPAGACSGTVNGLQPAACYFYRARVVNDAGEIWTDTAATFITLMDGLQFNRKMKVTLTGYTNTMPLVNFPALVVLNETPRGFKYSEFISPSGNDLRFTADDGIQTLNHEIESWNTNGNSYVWVNIPVLTNGTTLWAYWDNPSASALIGASVWTTNYIGVWHLSESSTDETSATVHRDSTAYAHNGGQNNNGPTPGIIAGAQNFDGTADFISVPASPSLTVAGPRTISAWIQPNVLGAGNRVVVGKSSWVGCTNLTLKASPGGESGLLLTTSSWQHVAYVQTETNVTFYYNGTLVYATNAATADSPTNRLDIGAFNGTLCFNGRIDEARLESGVRTPEWLQACYQNQSAPLAYATASTVVQYPDVAEPSGATAVTTDSAQLNGAVLSTGTTATTVWFYYGQTDGGKDTNAWDNVLHLGPQPIGTCSGVVSNLQPATLYYYRIYARNAAGGIWCDTPALFATLQQGSAFAHKMAITFPGFTNQVTLTNFPALIRLGEQIPGFFYGDLQTPPVDLRFTADDETTLLPYEVEAWSPTNTSLVWVRVPQLTPTTRIWAFWGNTNIHTVYPANSADTWSPEYAAVWHMNDAVTDEQITGTHYDSTTNYNTGRQNNNGPCEGIIGTGQQFDGVADYIDCGSGNSLDCGRLWTISMWAKPDNLRLAGIVSKGNNRAVPYEYVLGSTADGRMAVQDSAWKYSTYNAGFIPQQWNYLTYLMDGATTLQFYVNGSLISSTNFVLTANTAANVCIAMYSTVDANAFAGALDEIRIMNVVRTPEWIRACYLDQTTSSTFTAFGAVQSYPRVETGDASAITTTDAILHGNLISNGGSATQVHLCWGPMDGGQDTNLWANTENFSVPTEGEFTHPLNGVLTSGMDYYYRFAAENNSETTWATTTRRFRTNLDPSTYAHKAVIIFKGYTRRESLVNFPARVPLSTTLPFFSYGDLQANGEDLRFTAEGDDTPLNFQIDEWHPSGQSEIWVQVPRMETEGRIWMYWGNPSVSLPDYATNGMTWSENYLAVWHLNDVLTDGEEGNGIHTDSSPNHFDGEHHGSHNTPAFIGDGLAMNANRMLAPALSDARTQYSMNLWFKPTVALTAASVPLAMATNRAAAAILYVSSNSVSGNSGSGTALASAGALPVNQWKFLAFTCSNQTAAVYNATQSTETNNMRYPVKEWGGFEVPTNVTGVVDEIQISGIARSSNWLWAACQNQATPASFASIGREYPMPAIKDLGVSNIRATYALIHSSMISTGAAATTVTFYYGRTDHGESTSGWEKNITTNNMANGDFAMGLDGLFEYTNYYYRIHTQNAFGSEWATTNPGTFATVADITQMYGTNFVGHNMGFEDWINDWDGDPHSIVGFSNDGTISPYEGSAMMQLNSPDSTGANCDVGKDVDVSRYAVAITNDDVTCELSFRFNIQSWCLYPNFSYTFSFLSGTVGLGSGSGSSTADNDPATWETVSWSGKVPAQTKHIRVDLKWYGKNKTDLGGVYVDDLQMKLIVPNRYYTPPTGFIIILK